MDNAGGEPPRSPKQSFLATLRDSQVMLLSVRRWWSFRRSPAARGAPRPTSLEEGSSPAEEGEFSQQVLNGTQEIRSSQVSAFAAGVKSQGGGGWTQFTDRGSFHPRVGCGSGVGREGMNAALRPAVKVESLEKKSMVDESWVVIASYFQIRQKWISPAFLKKMGT